MRDGKGGHAQQARVLSHGRTPSHRRAPVVAQDVELVHANRVREREDILDQFRKNIGFNGFRTRTGTVATLIESHRRHARATRGGDQRIPHDRGFGKPMQHDDNRPAVLQSRKPSPKLHAPRRYSNKPFPLGRKQWKLRG